MKRFRGIKMGIRICFYVAVLNENDEEIKERENCVYCVEASEVCSEFIARYFAKTQNMPKELLDNVIEDEFCDLSYDNAKRSIANGIYKAKMEKMFEDEKGMFEFSAYKPAKLVRKKLIKKYQEIVAEVKKKLKNPKVDIYALLTV